MATVSDAAYRMEPYRQGLHNAQAAKRHPARENQPRIRHGDQLRHRPVALHSQRFVELARVGAAAQA
jgi:hypothetical protein